ncbi:MAG: peptidylprolyl isomerase [Planctomycetaceae bacterium]
MPQRLHLIVRSLSSHRPSRPILNRGEPGCVSTRIEAASTRGLAGHSRHIAPTMYATTARRLIRVALLIVVALGGAIRATAADAVATVNGHPIDAAELELLFLVRHVPDEQRPAVKQRFVDELIDQQLMADFLKLRGIKATKEEIDASVAAVRSGIERGGKSADEVLSALRLTEERLREVLALPLAWNRHVRLAVTDEQVQEYFRAHRAELDGTRRRVSQIVITLQADADAATVTKAMNELKSIRADVVAGKTTFANAAKAHSQSPSKDNGGDMGWEVYGTWMPKELADVAFQLPVKEVSEPFRTRFGVHLLQVTEQEPGDLSLEDVRGEVLTALSQQRWNEQLQQQRVAAKIERP